MFVEESTLSRALYYCKHEFVNGKPLTTDLLRKEIRLVYSRFNEMAKPELNKYSFQTRQRRTQGYETDWGWGGGGGGVV